MSVLSAAYGRSTRKRAARRVVGRVAVRSLSLQLTLRRFCLAAFALLAGKAAEGDELDFAFEEHRSPGRPPLYEYRPLAAAFVGRHEQALMGIEDTRAALDDLARLPQCSLFASAHSEPCDVPERTVLRAVLLPLVVKVVERCGGLDWDDRAFDRAYAELEQSLFADRRSYSAVAPLVGLTADSRYELGSGLVVRRAEAGELARHWPQAGGLLPERFASEPGRLLVLEWQSTLDPAEATLPDAPAQLADAVTALRLATAGAAAAGPVVFERLDWRPCGIRPLLPVASVEPPGETVSLDTLRARVAADVLARFGGVEADPELNEAIDRWELSLFQAGPTRAESLRVVVDKALGGGDGAFAGGLRAALLVGGDGARRRELLEGLRRLARGAGGEESAETVRCVLVEVLLHGGRNELVSSLDDSLLGLRPRPTAAFAARAAIG